MEKEEKLLRIFPKLIHRIEAAVIDIGDSNIKLVAPVLIKHHKQGYYTLRIKYGKNKVSFPIQKTETYESVKNIILRETKFLRESILMGKQ